MQEDWNLMYVAMTRARQVLIVSGSGARSTSNSWYQRLATAAGPPEEGALGDDVVGVPRAVSRPLAGPLKRSFVDFRPQPCPTGERAGTVESDAIRMGKAWHALLERAGQAGRTAEPERIGSEFGLNQDQAREVIEAARRVGQAPELARFFGSDAVGWSELELIDIAGDSVRVDRLVELREAIWILDYKWRCTPSERAGYDRQLARYAAVVASLHPGRQIRAALVLSDGSLLETELAGQR